MKIIAITQARVGSTRLPGKVLKKIGNKTLLSIHLERILKSKKIEQLIVATTTNAADEQIEKIAADHHLPCYRGSENDVLDRYYQAAKAYQPEWVVRVTSDCPLIDADLIDKIIQEAIDSDADYVANVLEPTFPNGTDVEVFKFSALLAAWTEATLKSDREHVTPFIYRNSTVRGGNRFTSRSITNDVNYGNVRITVDEEADFKVLEMLINQLGTDSSWLEYAKAYNNDHRIASINNNIERNEGYDKSLKND